MSTEDPEAMADQADRQDVSSLEDNVSRQQAKITELKELVRKSEADHGSSTSSAQEKVKNIAQRLTQMRSKVRSRQRSDASITEIKDEASFEGSQPSSPIPTAQLISADTPGSEKIQLLRRQVEESKQKMAEREMGKREIEERMIQLRAKFDSTQQSLERSSELGRSMGDLSALNVSSIKEKFKSTVDMSFTPLNLNKERIKFLENRIKILEKQIEKQANVHPTSESELITSLRNQILDLEENLRAKESIIQSKTQAVNLVSENLSAKTATSLDNLEETRVEMQKMQENFIESENVMQENIEKLRNELESKNATIRNLEEMNEILETARFEMTVKNADLESKLQGLHAYSTKLEELNKLNETLQNRINNLEEQLTEKTVECNVLNANFSVLQEKLKSIAPKPLFSNTGDEMAEMEMNRLKEQLDESNKSMIKIKLKCKQLQKQVDKFRKMSDTHSEAIRLTQENQELQEQIVELAKEKDNITMLTGGDSEKANESELEYKIKVLEMTCQNQTAAIKLLEEQKLELQSADRKLESSERLQGEEEGTSTETAYQKESIEMEEQAQRFVSVIDQLSADLEKLRHENESLRQEISSLEGEKRELQKKADLYMAENIELIDKIEKLSKSSSSAESIEIVERLTQQEKLEMEEFSKKMSAEEECTEFTDQKGKIGEQAELLMGQELSESLVKLREESSELMHRIELFTRERREVLEKMEILGSENQELIKQISTLEAEKSTVSDSLTKSKLEIVTLEEQLEKSLERAAELEASLEDSRKIKVRLEDEIKCLRNATQTSSVLGPETITQCKNGLTSMQTELENYRKSNDKSSRLNASKKLAKEARNVYQQFSDLLDSVTKESSAEQTSETNLEVKEIKEKCLELETIINSLKEELHDSKKAAEEKDSEIAQLSNKLDLTLEGMKKSQHGDQQELSALKTIRQELEAKLKATGEEISILNGLVSEQKQQLIEIYTEHEIELNAKVAVIQKYEQHVEALNSELEHVKMQNSKSQAEMRNDIKRMENMISDNEKLLAEQSIELQNKQDTIATLNAQIMDLYRAMEENSSKFSDKEDEIAYLQELLGVNEEKLAALINENESNKKIAEEILKEARGRKSSIEYEGMLADSLEKSRQLEEAVVGLERKNSELEMKNKEHVEKLKKFAANLKKKTAQCAELEAKIKTMDCSESAFSAPVKEQDHSSLGLEVESQKYKEEIQALSSPNVARQQLDLLNTEIAALKNEQVLPLERSQSLSRECIELRNELSLCKAKVKYFEDSVGEMEQLVDRLDHNMTEKEDELQRLQTEVEVSRNTLDGLRVQVESVREELSNKNLKFEKSKAVIKERNREIQRLAAELEDAKNHMSSTQNKLDSSNVELVQAEHLRALAAWQTEKESLEQKINQLEMLHNGAQAKIQENFGYIESLEAENNTYKDKIVKLENCIASFEERRQSLERETDMLDAKLQLQTDEYEKNEDALIYRLNMLLDHDDVIGKRLIEAQEKKEELLEKLDQFQIENSELHSKLNSVAMELEHFKGGKFREISAENENLQQQLKNAQLELTRQQNVYEGRLAQKHAEVDELENELSIQLNKINQEKRKLQEALEKSQDEVSGLKDENVKLKENGNSLEQTRHELEREITWIRMQNENMAQDQYEVQELRMQAIQDKTELDNLKHHMDSLLHNHEAELNMLREQIKELDSVRMQVGQNQTDDQVFIENENKRLKEELAEKKIAIENYQRENLKLKMMSMGADDHSFAPHFAGASQVIDLNVAQANPSMAAANEKIKSLEEEVAKLTLLMTEKDQLCRDLSLEAEQAKKQLQDMQQEASKLRTEFENLQQITKKDTEATHLDSYFAVDPNPVFEEAMNVRRVFSSETAPETPNLKKIEDLERSVLDLQKYVKELESKLDSSNRTHENILLQLEEERRRHEETVKEYEDKLKQIEMRLEQKEIQKNVESMIVANEATNQALPSLDIFFSTPQQSITEFDKLNQGSIDSADGSNAVPVQEELIVPKKAYLLHPADGLASLMDAEEGWSWGADEAILEERHQSELANLNKDKARNDELSECKTRINELTLEKSRLDEKVIGLQVKCGKLMKKLKEYKGLLERVDAEKVSRKSSSIDSCDLDQAIQDELKLQVQKLEEHVVEMRKQNEKDLAEKEVLVKKVDVLTNTNERLAETKKSQETKIEGLQLEIRQLALKMQGMETSSERDGRRLPRMEEFSSPNETRGPTEISETNLEDNLKELNDLRIDREELQALLDDEKSYNKSNEMKINELKEKIRALESENVAANADQRRISELEVEIKTLHDRLSCQAAELHESNVRNQNFQLQLNDYQATIQQLSTEIDSTKSHLAKLQQEYAESVSENTRISEEKNVWMDKSEALSKEVETWKSAAQLSTESAGVNAMLEEKVQDLTSQVQYKEAEISQLKQKVEDLVQNDQTQTLLQEVAVKNQEIEQLQLRLQQVESAKLEVEANMSKQTSEGAQIAASDADAWRKQVDELQGKLNDSNEEKHRMEAELQILNDHVLANLENESKMKELILEFDVRNIEIAQLKSTVATLTDRNAELENSTSQIPAELDKDVRIDEVNSSWERVVEEKCSEIAESWRQYLEQREAEFKKVESGLSLEIEQLRAGILVPKRKISEETESIEDETRRNMQTVLEQQELEIVTLKEQLAIRSAEYARLAARHDPYALSTSSNISIEPKTQRKSSSSSTTAFGSDQPAVVPKSELDLALYMLHQRGMRCEELTLELVSLLEERDTLQLKLSNSLRQIEEIKQKSSSTVSASESDQDSSNANTPEKSPKEVKSVVATDDNLNKSNLSSKLSELQTVGYVKDKRIKEEWEERQRQMEKIQQDVANIPSEAVSELVGSNLANSMQSPSNVLLDWLWGKNNNPQHS